MGKRVVVGMSGGVDSSVAALLLKEQGYDVVGLFMKNWEDDDEDGVCSAEQDYLDVRRVCSLLDIPYYSVNFSKQYQDRVFSYFLREYRAGRTPNPDVLCNREIKFGPFKKYAFEMGADYIATGHYAGIREENGLFYLTKAADEDKDQTYFLNQLSQKQLLGTLFPLKDLKKDEVREIAQKYSLSTAKKKDSTGICFIGERNFRNFLSTYLPAMPGDITDMSGKVLGRHMGLMFYTLGQRRGLDIGGVKGDGGGRWFVCKKDLEKNVLVVSHGDEDILYSDGAFIKDINFIPANLYSFPLKCDVRLRHRQMLQGATLFQDKSGYIVKFDCPQRAVTAGQFAVFYLGNDCIGGGSVDCSVKIK